MVKYLPDGLSIALRLVFRIFYIKKKNKKKKKLLIFFICNSIDVESK